MLVLSLVIGPIKKWGAGMVLPAMLGVAFTTGALAQAAPSGSSPPPLGGRGASAVPRFEDFPAPPGASTPNAPLVLAPRDRTYRTRLRAAATDRPNFAGHYVLVTWGCGTECVMGAAINARTGRVTFLPFTTCCYSEAPAGHTEMVAFRPDSALLVLLGMRQEGRAGIGAHYYRIEGDRLVHLHSVPFVARR